MTVKSKQEIEETIDRLNPEGFEWVREVLKEPPNYWKIIRRGEDGYMCVHRFTGLGLIASASHHSDSRRWLHVSISHPNKIPTYQELADAKRDFIGEDVYAYQVFAPTKDHVNIHPFCLHLWCCLDAPNGMVMPDMSEGTGSI
jgi:hypothetical protein